MNDIISKINQLNNNEKAALLQAIHMVIRMGKKAKMTNDQIVEGIVINFEEAGIK